VSLFLGIDGGGSKTRCVLGDEKSLLGSGSASGCNVLRVGEACAQSSLQAAIHEACVQAGISPQEIMRTCAGMAGGARPGGGEVSAGIVGGISRGDMDCVDDAFRHAPNGPWDLWYKPHRHYCARRNGAASHAIPEASGH
jgi:N-acetylglucosamine kinase-like BadF-type ATPase